MIKSQPIDRQKNTLDAGFTAVELMITLFIAAIFVTTGYQLYSVIVNDGTAARQQAKANNIAYEYLANYTEAVPANCAAASVTPTPPSGTGLPQIVITVNTTCPYADAPTLSRLEVIVAYGFSSPKQQVSSVVYATQ